MKKKYKRAVLGFLLVLILTLVLAGLTFYKIAEMFGLHKTQKAVKSFHQLVGTIKRVSKEPVGTRDMMALYTDEKSAILGFSRNSPGIVAFTEDDYIKAGVVYGVGGVTAAGFTGGMDPNLFVHQSARPAKCGSNEIACICLCRDYDWRYWKGGHSTDVACQEKFTCYNFTDFDFPSEITGKDFGGELGPQIYTKGGFIIARNYWIGGKDIESRLKGVYIMRQAANMMSVTFNLEGISEESINTHNGKKELGKLNWEAQVAFTSKEYNKAIEKYDEIIKDYIDLASWGERENIYLLRAMSYYHNHDKQGALKAFDEALDNISDQVHRDLIREKQDEVEGW